MNLNRLYYLCAVVLFAAPIVYVGALATDHLVSLWPYLWLQFIACAGMLFSSAKMKHRLRLAASVAGCLLPAAGVLFLLVVVALPEFTGPPHVGDQLPVHDVYLSTGQKISSQDLTPEFRRVTVFYRSW